MKSYPILRKSLIIGFLCLLPLSLFSQGSGGGAKKDYKPLWLSDCEEKLEALRKQNEVDPVQELLPFWGKALREEGYTLPLPMGVGISFLAMQQTNKISDFKLLIDGTELPLDLKVYDAQSVDMNFTFRPDLWILPFLNVYGVIGYTEGSIQPTVIIPGLTADLPNLGEVEITKAIEINEKITYEGLTYGFGTTLAGGYGSFFGILDYNYTISDMDVLPQNVVAQTLTGRIGITTEAMNAKGKGRIWVGGMYMHINQKISSSINLAELDPEIAAILGDEIGVEMTMGVKEPLNLLLGGSWLINARMNLMIEAGVGDRSQLMVGVDYRF